jgi:hypothetical protein
MNMEVIEKGEFVAYVETYRYELEDCGGDLAPMMWNPTEARFRPQHHITVLITRTRDEIRRRLYFHPTSAQLASPAFIKAALDKVLREELFEVVDPRFERPVNSSTRECRTC